MTVNFPRLLKLLFPSWRFFEDFSAYPKLYYRYREGTEFGPWLESLPAKPRSWFSIFLNGDENFRLFANSAIERLLSGQQDLENIVKNIIVLQIPLGPGLTFQYKICEIFNSDNKDIFISAEMST